VRYFGEICINDEIDVYLFSVIRNINDKKYVEIKIIKERR
jgi:hypothetical protein